MRQIIRYLRPLQLWCLSPDQEMSESSEEDTRFCPVVLSHWPQFLPGSVSHFTKKGKNGDEKGMNFDLFIYSDSHPPSHSR